MIVGTGRDSAVTEYVRARIREWEASGRDQRELATKAGVSEATISQVKTRIGVGSRSIDGFARALDFPSAAELRNAAYSWYQQKSAMGNARADEPAVAAAIASVLSLQPRVTRAQLDTILFAFSHERFNGRDEAFWIPTLLMELRLEVSVAERERAESNRDARDKRARKSQLNGALRAEHRRRNEAAAAAEALKPLQVEPAAKKAARR